MRDIRHALRALARSPGFLAAAVLSLALGIGANTAIFSLVNAALLRPMPGQDPGRLVNIFTSDFSGPLYGSTSYPDYQDFRRARDVLADAAAWSFTAANLALPDSTERASLGLISANYFRMLGVRPVLGRSFTDEEEASRRPVAMLSEAGWRRFFGGDTNILGRTMALNGTAFTIVGVVADRDAVLERIIRVHAYVPIQTGAAAFGREDRIENRGSRGLNIVARLAPGVTVARAQQRFRAIAVEQYRQYPEMWRNRFGAGRSISVVSERESRLPPQFQGQVETFMAMLLAVVGLVLLIACANIANLMLARAMDRRAETAVRLALGATRWRLARQYIAESVLVAAAGGAAGVVLAAWTAGLLQRFRVPVPVELAIDLSFDWRVLAFAALASIAAAVFFGVAPALRAARVELVTSLKGAHGAGRAWRGLSLRNLLVIGQAAASVLLLTGAGLFLRSLNKANSLDLGFEPSQVALLSASPNRPEPQRGFAYYRQALERLAGVPGAQAASVASSVPLDPHRVARRFFTIEGYTPQGAEDREVNFNLVGPRYFEVMRIRLTRGRDFTPTDRDGAPRVAIVNEAFVRRYWPNQDPIGKRLASGSSMQRAMEVIGVAAPTKHRSLSEQPLPIVYAPFLQEYRGEMTFHVRTAGPPAAALEPLRKALLELDRGVATFDINTLPEQLTIAVLPLRMAATLFAIFGGLALVLAAVGLYGVMAHSVSRRTRELGVRIALGAARKDVLAMVLWQGMTLSLAGIALGILAAIGLTRLIAGFLFGVSPADPLTLIAVALLLAAVAALACLAPARRATAVDPAVTLRYE